MLRYASPMRAVLDPFRFVITTVAGWMNQHQQRR
jgi:hypothetical protein